MKQRFVTRREFNHASLISLLPVIASFSAVSRATASGSPPRHVVTKPRLPRNPERQITLIEVVYPPGEGSPPHMHANGVMALVVSGLVASKVGDAPERVFRSGDACWEPPGAIHRVSRNASSSEEARLLALYIPPQDAREADLMRPI